MFLLNEEVWTTVSRLPADERPSAIRNAIRTLTANGISIEEVLDFHKGKLCLLGECTAEFVPTVTLLVREAIPLPETDGDLKRWLDMFQRNFENGGVPARNLDGRLKKVGGRQAVFLEYEMQPCGAIATRHRLVILADDIRNYHLMLTSSVEGFSRNSLIFDAILESFKLPVEQR